VFAHVSLHPPRKPPQPPPNVVDYVPSPDLRDHNTVVKEFHNYVTRLSPHLLYYPSFYPSQTANQAEKTPPSSASASTNPTSLDLAIKQLILDLKPFGLTKAEVLMILNLGVGLENEPNTEQGESDVALGEAVEAASEQQQASSGDVGEGVEGEGEEGGDKDYGALALLDTVIEDREERLSDEDIIQILKIIRSALGPAKGRKRSEEQIQQNLA
ncbi:hypothetical protein KEM54_002848, partial [Ascosphaera aggregata]